MSTMISTPSSSELPGNHYQTKNVIKRNNPRSASSANQMSGTNVNRDMNNQHYQHNRNDLESQVPESTSSPQSFTGSTGTAAVDGSVIEPTQKTGQSNLPGKKKKGRQSSKVTAIGEPPQSIAFVSPTPTRSTSTGNAIKSTPGKPLGTPPKQAYAGPTFHASPAPSALPIPRFFSKSVPEVVSSNGLQSKMVESSSESSESSPTPATRQMAGEPQHREESPLDFFFKADREEKAKARRSTPLATPLQGMHGNGSAVDSLSPSPPVNLPSPFNGPSRQHSRHPTGGSASDMFTFDMDGGGGNGPTKPSTPAPAQHSGDRTFALRSNTAPSNMITQSSLAEEQRRAKTQALKDLLLSPQPQKPSSSSLHYGVPTYELGDNSYSSSPSLSPRGNNSSKISAAPGPDLAKTHARRSYHGSSPFLHDSLLAFANGSSKPTTRSSNLRQELSPVATAHRAESPIELPGSPASKQSNGFDTSSFSRSNVHLRTFGNLDGSPQARSRNSQRLDTSDGPGIRGGSPGVERDATNKKVMGNDLRRILNMATVDVAGVSGLADESSMSAASSENRPPLNGSRDTVSGF